MFSPVDLHKSRQCGGHPVDIAPILREVQRAAQRKQWVRASHRWLGTGLRDGVEARCTQATLRKLRRDNKPGEAAMLAAVASAKVWPRERRELNEAPSVLGDNLPEVLEGLGDGDAHRL